MLVAYERLGPAWAASLILLADLLPAMLLGPLVGAWLDRRDRLRFAIAADVVRAGALVMIVVPGAIPLLALAVVAGLGNAVFRPAVNAVLPSVVDEGRLPAANALRGGLENAGLRSGRRWRRWRSHSPVRRWCSGSTRPRSRAPRCCSPA